MPCRPRFPALPEQCGGPSPGARPLCVRSRCPPDERARSARQYPRAIREHVCCAAFWERPAPPSVAVAFFAPKPSTQQAEAQQTMRKIPNEHFLFSPFLLSRFPDAPVPGPSLFPSLPYSLTLQYPNPPYSPNFPYSPTYLPSLFPAPPVPHPSLFPKLPYSLTPLCPNLPPLFPNPSLPDQPYSPFPSAVHRRSSSHAAGIPVPEHLSRHDQAAPSAPPQHGRLRRGPRHPAGATPVARASRVLWPRPATSAPCTAAAREVDGAAVVFPNSCWLWPPPLCAPAAGLHSLSPPHALATSREGVPPVNTAVSSKQW